ncbi:MAG: hypothetical protein IKE66_13860 [Hyphomicrobium sp.]|nr:hypothetical protein [Hyphomicrobium sp.]
MTAWHRRRLVLAQDRRLGVRNHRYSALEQINASNIGQMKPKWSFSFGDEKQRGQETQALVQDGIIYVTASYSRAFAGCKHPPPWPDGRGREDQAADGRVETPQSGAGFRARDVTQRYPFALSEEMTQHSFDD